MFMNTSHFYFATQRKLVAAFGALFTNVKVSRYSGKGNVGTITKTFTVPVGYGPASKWIRLAKEYTAPKTPNAKKTRIRASVPRISFELVDMQYNPERKLQTMVYNHSIGKNNDDIAYILRQLNPVPYDFSFDVSIITENYDDAFQILEQILPNFAPTVNLVLKDIPELDREIVTDVSVILAAVQRNDNWQGMPEDDRYIVYNLSFVVKGWLYPVITDGDLIKKVITKLYPNEDMSDPATSTITVSVDPIEALPEDEYDIIKEIDNDE